ncbi:MAG: mraW [Sphingobacteriaceae bacterium]|jgi:phospholipid N-methyltransferase|nr:mraW [Sphingobacteriaceae bacterium]
MIKVNALRYIRKIKTTGALSESSIFVIRTITNDINPNVPQVIVEVGAGTGNVTSQILKKMHPKSVLYCFEIDHDFIKDLQKINDQRFHLIQKSAFDISQCVSDQSVDVVISTLPLTLFTAEQRCRFLRDCLAALKPTGIYRQFLYSFKKRYFSNIFDQVNVRLAVINFPPAVIYACSQSGRHHN